MGTKSVTVSPVVGAPGVLQVELAGKETVKVSLRTLLEAGALRKAGCLPMAVALDTRGHPIVCDLADLPHLLIAGAPGTGKSTVLRAMIVCLLYQFRPEDLQLVLVDPKKVEGGLFHGLPHLRRSVITEAQEACQALSGLVVEMKRRYSLFEAGEATSLRSYNEKHPNNRLPHIVCVIDELAVLMGSEVKRQTETVFQALAQESRAAGIHLIVATQRPSVDVVTGIIKANLPARLSLRLGSMADSRTILDWGGAEHLRGKGDLYFQSESDLIRGQGAVVTEKAVRALVEWWARQRGSLIPSTAVPEGVAAPEPQGEDGHVDLRQEQCSSPSVHSVATPEPHSPPTALTREEQELRWVREQALAQGFISRRIVEKGLGIRAERAGSLLRVLDEEGWLLAARSRYPRRIALAEEERRARLAQLRQCRPEDIRFDGPEGDLNGESDEEECAQTQNGRDLKGGAVELERLVARALKTTPLDFAGLTKLLARLDAAIDVALEQVDPVSF